MWLNMGKHPEMTLSVSSRPLPCALSSCTPWHILTVNPGQSSLLAHSESASHDEHSGTGTSYQAERRDARFTLFSDATHRRQ